MYKSKDVVDRTNQEFMKLGLMGVTILAASGDGGSHFSFNNYSKGPQNLVKALNNASCKYNYPVFPTDSPYVLSVGGSSWDPEEYYMCGASSNNPVGWNRGGSGFSLDFDMPDYQTKIVNDHINNMKYDTNTFNSKGRA